MMLIVCDTDPKKAVDYLVNNSSQRFYTKQLLELYQLICSCGYSSIFNKIPQGKEIQAWIKQNPKWTMCYLYHLLDKCKNYYKPVTMGKFHKINKETLNILNLTIENINSYPEINTIIFRYRKDYNGTNYSTNSELPTDLAIKEYKKYLNWKFPIFN